MNSPEPKNIPASVHQRLLNKARTSGRPFNELFRYYAIERFLYRLSKSPYHDLFVLKGALIFTAWGMPLGRTTRDVDLLAYTANGIDEVELAFRAICLQTVESDGFNFDPATVTGQRIAEHADFQGVRVHFLGYLGTARAQMQVDLGFGDVVTPPPELVEYPSLLAFPRPVLRGYTRETVVAEKAHALVTLGTLNSRMKDFYDLWLLARQFDFDGPQLSAAVTHTFTQRNSTAPVESVESLLDNLGELKQDQWQAFLRTSGIGEAPQDLVIVLSRLREFLIPVLRMLTQEGAVPGYWQAPGPWQEKNSDVE